MESPAQSGPFEREAEQATEQTVEGSSEFSGEGFEGDRDSNLSDTDETEMSGSAEPGTTATPEGTSEVSD